MCERITTSSWNALVVAVGFLLLCVIVAALFSWPAYRASLDLSLANNEGWNAVFADAAMGKMPLYPPADALMTNNYPPLSFYVVGVAGRIIGDNIVAGRLISLFSVLAIGGLLALIVQQMTGDRLAGWTGGVFFIGMMCRCADKYVGMNEPQLLAHLVMAAAWLWFVRRQRQEAKSCLGPILLFTLGGFFKHNIVAMPFAAMLWLAWRDRKQFGIALLVSMAAIGAGFGACALFYGHDFFYNFFSPRVCSWSKGLAASDSLLKFVLPLAVWSVVGVVRRSDPWVQLCNLLVICSLGSFFLQRCGEGVAQNAIFDLVIALGLGMGLAFAHLPRMASRLSAELVNLAFLLVLMAFLFHGARFHIKRVLRDAGFRQTLAKREEIMANAILQARAIPGDVLCDGVVCYRAGKPLIDEYNVGQRIIAGQLPADCIEKRLRNGELTYVDTYGIRLGQRLPNVAKGK